jgi:hypothetical protein
MLAFFLRNKHLTPPPPPASKYTPTKQFVQPSPHRDPAGTSCSEIFLASLLGFREFRPWGAPILRAYSVSPGYAEAPASACVCHLPPPTWAVQGSRSNASEALRSLHEDRVAGMDTKEDFQLQLDFNYNYFLV